MKKAIFLVMSIAVVVFTTNNSFAQCGNHSGSSASNNHSEHNSASMDNKNMNKAGMKTFKVYGNCDMCKARIEKAAIGVKGVKSASWDKETKMVVVNLKEGVDVNDVYQAIVKAGHDTEELKVADNIYANLPGCCKYRE